MKLSVIINVLTQVDRQYVRQVPELVLDMVEEQEQVLAGNKTLSIRS
jgi:hypothetical protein